MSGYATFNPEMDLVKRMAVPAVPRPSSPRRPRPLLRSRKQKKSEKKVHAASSAGAVASGCCLA